MESVIKFGLIAIIVLGAIGISAISDYWRHRRKMETIRARTDMGDGEKLSQEVEALKERVATLEKIVTDKGYQLHEEIERLREAAD